MQLTASSDRFTIVPGPELAKAEWGRLAKFNGEFSDAVNRLDPAPIIQRLAPKVVWESQAVLRPLTGKETVAQYLKAKFETIKRSTGSTYTELGVVDLPEAERHPCVIGVQDGKRVCLFVLKMADDEISRVDIFTVVPSPSVAVSFRDLPPEAMNDT